MNIIVGPYAKHPAKLSMYTALTRLDDCLTVIRKTGVPGLTAATATLSLNLTQLMGCNVIVTNDQQRFTVIVHNQPNIFTLTGCLIEDTFHNIVNPLTPSYLIALDHQLITTGDELVENIYRHY